MATSPQKKAKKSRPTGPSTLDLVVKAITALKDPKGSSNAAIKKQIASSGAEKSNLLVNKALKRGVETGVLKQVKGTGANGTFKLDTVKAKKAEQEKAKKIKTAERKKAATEKAKAKKEATKAKKAAKKTTKKPAAKKAAKKTPKKSASKPKKAVKPKKKAAKTPVKKAAKKPAKKAASKKKPAKK